MKVLVTGANGFVGRYLLGYLRSAGIEAVGGVRSPAAVAEESSVVIGDLGKPLNLAGKLDGFDAIVHLAAIVHRMSPGELPSVDEYLRVNRDATAELAESAANSGLERFIFLSTVKVLGECTDGVSFNQDTRPHPDDPYALSKWEAEAALWDVCARTGLEGVVIRPPLIYGPGVAGNFARAVALVAKDWPLPFGAIDNRRSMVGVRNLCGLIHCCLASPEASGRSFLVSDGEDISTAMLFRLIGQGLGKSVRLLPVPPGILRLAGTILGRGPQVARLCDSLCVDITETRNLLGWQPECSVGDSIAEAVESFRRQTVSADA